MSTLTDNIFYYNLSLLLQVIAILIIVGLVYLYIYKRQQRKQLEKKVISGKWIDKEDGKLALLLWIEEIGRCINDAEPERKKYHGVDRDDYDRQIYKKILLCDNINNMRTMIDQRLNGYSSRLLSLYPQLNEKDELLVYLHLLKIKKEDIILLSGYSPNSLPKIKNRLCKKMKIEGVSQLYDTLICLL